MFITILALYNTQEEGGMGVWLWTELDLIVILSKITVTYFVAISETCLDSA